MEALLNLGAQAEAAVLAAGGVFVRISAMVFFLPGFGERTIAVQVKLGGALAFAAIIWPTVNSQTTPLSMTLESVGAAYAAEAITGLLLGLSLRFVVFALQTAGTLAAQNLSLTQMFGAGVSLEPEPTIGTILTLGGITLALSLGLHVKIAALMIQSYTVLPFGQFAIGSDAAEWSVARASQMFNLAVSLALPFILVAFVYNVALGAINRAQPQLMVSFIGLPAITWLGMVLLMITSTAAVQIWHDRLDAVIAAPLSTDP